MLTPADPRAIARTGLENSVGGFLRTRSAIHAADTAVHDIIDLAASTYDAADLGVARVGQATAGALRASPVARLGVLRATLSRVEAGATSTVGYLSKMGYDLLDAIDAAKPAPALRATAVQAALDAIAEHAADQHLREADYAGYAADLGHVVTNPVYVLNMLDRVNVPTVGDVTRPAWFASVAFSFATGAQFESDASQLERILDLADPRIASEARRQNDTPTLQHLDRESRYSSLPGLSPDGQRALHLASLRLIGDEVPYAPETALVLAHQARQQQTWSDPAERKADVHVIIDAAFVEARQAGYRPGTPAAAWLRFHDDLPSLGLSTEDAARLEAAAFHALVEGKPATPAEIRFDLAQVFGHLAQPDPTPQARAVFDALDRLLAPPPQPSASDSRIAQLGLDLADIVTSLPGDTPRPDVATALLDAAFTRIRCSPSARPDRQAILDIATLAVQADPAGTSTILRDALVRITRLDTDPLQKAILDAANPNPAPAPAAPAIRQEDDFVVIGSVRVPRKALAK